MREREWRLTENIVARVGLFIAASYAFYIGNVQWVAAADALHPVVVGLELVTYLFGFAALVSAVTGWGLRYTRHLIPVLLVFGLLIQSYLRIDGQPRVYGTDSAAFTQRAAEVFLAGQNPYGQDMRASLEEFHVAWAAARVDGPFEPLFQYPALGFMLYVPFILAGLGDARIVLLVFHVLLLVLLYVSAPRWLRPLALIPLFISPEITWYTQGTVTDLPWVFFVTAAAVLWKRRDASALLYGVAISTKQQPWLLAPFILIRLWEETRGLTTGARLSLLARYFGIAEVIFLLTNGPFLLASPREWIAGVLTPSFGALVMEGSGLSTLSQVGLVNAPRFFYTLAAILVLAALLIVYWAQFNRLRNALWLFPAIVLWLPYRSLQSYIIYWIAPLMVALYAHIQEVGTPRLPAPREWRPLADPVPSRVQTFRNRLAAGAVAAAACFVVGGIVFFAVFGKPAFQVNVQRALVDPASNLISAYQVQVTNNTGDIVSPVFWVKQTGKPPFAWTPSQGPQVLAGGTQARYLITAPSADYAVPNGIVVTVQVNDAQNANAYGFSPASTVNLVNHASLLNADFLYWTGASESKPEQPFAWGFYQIGQTGSRSTRLTGTEIAGKQCVALTATQTATAARPELFGGFLDQWTELPHDRLRVPVYPTFHYQGGDSPRSVLGIEVRDETHQLWYIFSDDPERVWQDSGNANVAYHLINAPLDQWSEHLLDISADYHALNWELPADKPIIQNGDQITRRMINFRLFVASRDQSPGTYSGCFGAIIQHLP